MYLRRGGGGKKNDRRGGGKMVERKQVHILFLTIKYLYITYHEMSLPFLLQAVDVLYVHREVFVSVVSWSGYMG